MVYCLSVLCHLARSHDLLLLNPMKVCITSAARLLSELVWLIEELFANGLVLKHIMAILSLHHLGCRLRGVERTEEGLVLHLCRWGLMMFALVYACLGLYRGCRVGLGHL